MKTIIQLLIIALISIKANGQQTQRIVAVLNDEVNSYDLLVNDKPYHTLTEGELFYYYPEHETALTVNKKSGTVPMDLIKKIDTIKYLKFSFSQADLKMKEHHEDLLLAESLRWDYRTLVSKASRKDGKALKKLLTLEKHVDGAAAEVFPSRYFKLIHFWRDSELAILIKNDSSNFSNDLLSFLQNEFYTGFNREEIDEYMTLFYPLTWEELKE